MKNVCDGTIFKNQKERPNTKVPLLPDLYHEPHTSHRQPFPSHLTSHRIPKVRVMTLFHRSQQRIDYHALVEGQANRPIRNPGDDMYVPDEGNRRRNSVDDMYIPDDENLRGTESQEEPHTEPPAETGPTEDVKPSPGVLQPPKKSVYDLPPGQPGRPNSGGYSMEKKLVNECGLV